MSTPDSRRTSVRGEHLDYFGARPECGCITAWLASDAIDVEVSAFAQRMRVSGRDVIRAELTDEMRSRLRACPHVTRRDVISWP